MVINVNAQWFIGGKIGLNIKSSETTDDTNNTLKSTIIGFSIAPKGGYYFNEKLALGLSFSVGTNFLNVSNDFFPQEKVDISIPWRIRPFVRYSVFAYKNFSLILEGSTGIGGEQLHEKSEFPYHDITKIEKQASTIGIGVINVTPILGLKLSDHFQLEAGLNFLNLGYNIDISNRFEKITNEIGAETSNKTKTINHDFNIGFNSSSILVVSQLTIGVIYKF